MEFVKTDFDGLFIVKPEIHFDNRGRFTELFKWYDSIQALAGVVFMQDNYSESRRGVLRGLHYQLEHPQGKLVFVAHGEIFDVAVDLRGDSLTYGKYFGLLLSDVNLLQVYIPPGFAHGFYVLSETAKVIYKNTDYYYPDDQYGIRWDDPTLNIKWPILSKPFLSEKDSCLPYWKDIPEGHLPKSFSAL